MARYILTRLLFAVPSLLFVSLVIFSLLRLIPGDAVMQLLADSGGATPELLHRMRVSLGLDQPFAVQYVVWLSHLIRGDFGRSLWTAQPVLPLVLGRMKLSLEIAIMAITIAVAIAIPLGVTSATHQNKWGDYTARLFAIGGLSIPDFFIATMLLLFLSKSLHWLPQFGWFSPITDPVENFEALIFPALIIGYRLSAVTSRMTRSAMLEVLRNDYIRTARAKGLPDRAVIVKHALRNAMIPVVTIIGSQLAGLLGGLVIVEEVFNLPGMGRLTLDAVNMRDYPIVQGTVMVMATVFVLGNLLVDLSYGLLDPRIRFS